MKGQERKLVNTSHFSAFLLLLLFRLCTLQSKHGHLPPHHTHTVRYGVKAGGGGGGGEAYRRTNTLSVSVPILY